MVGNVCIAINMTFETVLYGVAVIPVGFVLGTLGFTFLCIQERKAKVHALQEQAVE